MLRRSLTIGSCAALLLAGCGSSQLPALPDGPQTVTGTVVPMAISLVRRGTHVLRQNDQDLYTLESLTVDLGDYAGRIATVRGVLQRNADPADLPVLMVSDVLSAEEATLPWESRPLGLSADIPRTWSVRETPEATELVRGEASDPVVRMVRDPAGTLPAEGELLLMDRWKAVRFVDPLTGAQTVTIELSPGTLAAAFLPPESAEQAAAARLEWDTFIRSIRIAAGASSVRSAPATGTGSTTPCGGTAGILCPAGFYCEITDTVSTVGVCRHL